MPFLLKLSTAVLVSLLVSAAAAADDHKAYVQLNIGAVFAESYTDGRSFCDNFFGCSSFSYKERSDPGYVAGGAIGYRLLEQFRLEGEAIYQSSGLDKSILAANTQRFGGLQPNGKVRWRAGTHDFFG